MSEMNGNYAVYGIEEEPNPTILEYRIKGWYKVGDGPEEIEDERTYQARNKLVAMFLARKDGLSKILNPRNAAN